MSEVKVGDEVVVNMEGYGYYSGTNDTWPLSRQAPNWDGKGGVVYKSRDADGDVEVSAPYYPYDRSVYVRPEFVTQVEKQKEDVIVESDAADPQLPGVWVTYYRDPIVAITIHEDEISALRYAVANQASVTYLGYGEELVP